MILVIDNYDSFTYNLVHYLNELGAETVVHRNDALTAAFKRSPRIKILDAPDEAIYPMPTLAAADDAVHVGRLRVAGNHFWGIATVDAAAFVARAAVRVALQQL